MPISLVCLRLPAIVEMAKRRRTDETQRHKQTRQAPWPQLVRSGQRQKSCVSYSSGLFSHDQCPDADRLTPRPISVICGVLQTHGQQFVRHEQLSPMCHFCTEAILKCVQLELVELQKTLTILVWDQCLCTRGDHFSIWKSGPLHIMFDSQKLEHSLQ